MECGGLWEEICIGILDVRFGNKNSDFFSFHLLEDEEYFMEVTFINNSYSGRIFLGSMRLGNFAFINLH